MEREGDRLEEGSEKLGDRIEQTRRDWGARERDPGVPGAQPERSEHERAVPGVQADEKTVTEEGGP